MQRRLRGHDGFTLTELLMTVTVVGILFAIAVPAIQLQIAREDLRSSARNLVEAFRSARTSAMDEGVPRYVLLRPGAPGTYQAYRFNGAAWVSDRNEVPLGGHTSFTDADVTMPGLAGVPKAGSSVPANAAYFDTRGRYPFGYSGSYTITLHPASGDPVTLTLYPQSGQVTGV